MRRVTIPPSFTRGKTSGRHNVTHRPGIIDAYLPAELRNLLSGAEMIARPSDITRTSPTTPDPASAESPMQRQILLWQREILKRAEAGKRVGGEAGK
jgi:hypothetical protein